MHLWAWDLMTLKTQDGVFYLQPRFFLHVETAHLLPHGEAAETDGLSWRPPGAQNFLLRIMFYRMRKKYSKTSKALETYTEASINTSHVVCSTIYYLVIIFGYTYRYWFNTIVTTLETEQRKRKTSKCARAINIKLSDLKCINIKYQSFLETF